jgi:nanoRNase/pAp phosphatase (c-di-AMP/oligoRNAs hydrolase)
MSVQQESLERLFRVVSSASEILILPHNNPDPDAIASAVALHHLLAERPGVKSYIAYQGLIGRAENRALMRYLGYPLQPLTGADLHRPASIALVDTQLGAGNNPLAPESNVAIVIDHHTWLEATAAASFADIRPELGATATILTEYLQAADIEPDPYLATALFYGIQANTMGLSRDASSADASAYFYLQPRVDVKALAKIEHAQVPAEYFKSFDAALRAARVYDGVVIAYVGQMNYPDLTAEMADLLLRLERSRWVICMGVYQDILTISVRTRNRRGAGQLTREIIGSRGTAGGHGTMAGGQIPLRGEDPEQMAQQLSRRALQYLEVPSEVVRRPLI